jgi:hypothetical protein
MTAKELIAEIKTIQKLNDDKKIHAICDILIDIVKAIDKEKPQFGFRGNEK